MDELVRWLGEQLDEDERTARAATLGPWVQSGIGDYGWTVDFGRPGAGVETADTEQGLADADFIAAHNPARVLREIDAKRQVLKLHSPSEFGPWVGADDDDEPACRVCGDLTVRFPCRTLRLLALPYADRPGYLESWRP